MKTKNILLAFVLFCPFCSFAETSNATPPKDNTEIWISFLPVIFFALILIATAIKLIKGGVKSFGIFSEKDWSAGKAEDPQTPPQSVSRVIAFLTGLVALTLGTCLSTFFMYNYFFTPPQVVNLSNLNTVILGLGIGVIPYGVNKAASALRSNH